jgi:putative sigma-54 modulation protein
LKIQYKSRNLEVSDAMKEYFTKKMAKLEKLVNDEDGEVEVRFSKMRQLYTVEVTLKMRSIIVRAEEKTKDFYASVDNAIKNLERRLKRFKDRFRTLKREKAVEETTTEESGEEEKVVKVKKFELRPMSVDEAMIQLDLLDHEFFMFRNAENDQINVLYRRRDGNYGLIIPQ